MTIQQLEYIVAVDNHRSFAKAAESCFVTQPTLSMQIKKLEELWDVILFDRSRKPVIPTAVGSEIISQARKSLISLKAINEIIHDNTQSLSGELRVGIIPTLSPYLLPRVIPGFTEKYPDLELIIEEEISELIFSKLERDQLDVGIMVASSEQANISEEVLFYERFFLYASEKTDIKKNVDIDDLNLDDLWLLEEGHCFRDQIASICGKRLRQSHTKLRFQSGSLETLRRMVDNNYGFTLLPELAIDGLPESKKQQLREFKNIKPLRKVSLCFHRSFLKRRLINVLKEEITTAVSSKLRDPQRGEVIDWK